MSTHSRRLERGTREVDEEQADRLSELIRRNFSRALKELANLDNPMRTLVGGGKEQVRCSATTRPDTGGTHSRSRRQQPSGGGGRRGRGADAHRAGEAPPGEGQVTTDAGQGRMAGRRAVVVGAGQELYGLAPDEAPMGNGRATALLLASEGAGVACVDRVQERAAETVARIEAQGGEAVAVGADASDEAETVAMLDQAATALGGIDAVVLNVGIGGPFGLGGTNVDAWDRTFAVNVRSHFLGLKHGLPRMDDGGAVVLVSSVAGSRPGSRMPAYDASKAALAGLARHAALEGERRGIRVNVVVPGLIDTPIGRAASRDRPGRAAGRLPLGRQGTAWDVAHAVLFLLSAEASYVNGQQLFVDGGLSTLR